MSLIAVVIVFFTLCFDGILVGGYVNLRSVRSGHGPSPTGNAIQVVAIFVVFLSGSFTLLIAIAKSGLWAAALLLIPMLIVPVILLLGAVQGLRARRRP